LDVHENVLQMKTATVRELRNHYTSLLRWVAAGEEVQITQRGVTVARLLPAEPPTSATVNWQDSPEVKRNRRRATRLTAAQSSTLIREAGGQW
jgi:prevent-host-death family protein